MFLLEAGRFPKSGTQESRLPAQLLNGIFSIEIQIPTRNQIIVKIRILSGCRILSGSWMPLKNQGRDSIHFKIVMKIITKNITKNVLKILPKSYNKTFKKSANDAYLLFKLDFRDDFRDNFRDIFKCIELHPRSMGADRRDGRARGGEEERRGLGLSRPSLALLVGCWDRSLAP